MFARVLALIAALMLATASTEARAYAGAPASEAKKALLGFIALDLNPFQEKSPLTPSATKEKSLGSAAASIGREYYLRARYMDPGQGRFVGMDVFAGSIWDPATSHDYSWVSNNPISRVDPTGKFSITELNAAQNIATRLIMASVKDYAYDTASGAFIRNLVSSALGGNIQGPGGSTSGAGIVTALAIMCKSGKSRCLLKGIPTFISGREIAFSSIHILMAQFGHGNTSDDVPRPLPFLLVRGSGRDDVFPREGRKGCIKLVSAIPTVCDEYPYASTMQGGQTNYDQGRVSLHLVPEHEGLRQARILLGFYRRAGVTSGRPFLNVALPTYDSAFIDARGKWRRL